MSHRIIFVVFLKIACDPAIVTFDSDVKTGFVIAMLAEMLFFLDYRLSFLKQ